MFRDTKENAFSLSSERCKEKARGEAVLEGTPLMERLPTKWQLWEVFLNVGSNVEGSERMLGTGLMEYVYWVMRNCQFGYTKH